MTVTFVIDYTIDPSSLLRWERTIMRPLAATPR